MKRLFILFLLLFPMILFPQSLPIFLDGRTGDWNIPVPTYIDDENDGNLYDFKYISVTNDEQFLFIKLKTTPFFKLTEDNQLSIFIDGDNNSSTGYQINNIGAEIRFNFGTRDGTRYYNGTVPISHSDIQYRSLPTVTDTIYEIAIGRQFIPPANGTGTIKLFLIDFASNGDWMPNSGETFGYTFDETPTEPLFPTEINREDTSFLRIMDWNVLNDGLIDPTRQQSFTRLLQAINPDIICFNECFSSSATQVKNAINQMLPGTNWNAVKLDDGNVTVSRYPILQNWLVYPGHRITASLIDLPEWFGKDLLVINSHLKCCGGQINDDKRQLEVDATIAFILDAKTPGGVINLASETPFVILGDLNLVGNRQQLITLLTGEIINTSIFGNGGPPDWDNTDLEDLLSQQTDKRTAYTWRDDGNSFPPGRLDFQIYSNSEINVEKDFVIQTEVMSASRLNQYGLQLLDTGTASDHFPKITDLSFDTVTSVGHEFKVSEYKLEQNYPNPFNPKTNIGFQIASFGFVSLNLYDILGNHIATLINDYLSAGEYEVEFSANELPSGIYFYQLKATPVGGQAGNYLETKKMMLLK
ncbi:MAG: endonuclease/exonuclease/phosphatase family protein [Ignavibacteriaceae bacterium]